MIVCFLVTAGFLGFITFESEVVSAGNIIYVGSGLGNHTPFIQDAIDNFANPGDTVFVYSGVYGGGIMINKTINLIGEDRNTTIIEGGGLGVVNILSTEWVNITGFTITNGYNGIWTIASSNCTFKDNIVRDNNNMQPGSNHGFFFSGTPYSNNRIIGNIVYNNDGDGIHLEDQSSVNGYTFWNNSIINNTVYNNKNDGIFIGTGTNNFVIDNIVHHNGLGSINPTGGIRISRSQNNVVMGNTVHDNDNGIVLSKSIPSWLLYNNTIAENIIYNNDNAGIRLRDASDNTFIENSIFNNNYSVYMEQQSRGNNFINCTLSNASNEDFYLTEKSHALLLNTTFDKARVYYGDSLSSGGDTGSSLTVKWYMHVKVIYWNGSPVSSAEIWVNETFGTNLLHTNADSLGWIRWFIVTEYIEWDMDGDHIGDRFYFPPLNVTATDGNLWGYAEPIMDKSKVVLIILGAPTELLPPTNLTTKTVNNGNSVELEWDPPSSPALDHYLIYRADSATEFDFTTPYNISTTWLNPLNTTWVDPDSGVTAVDDDFYYIVRATNFDESVVSVTSNTAGVWTRTFQSGISTFSLPLEPFVKNDSEFYCQDMNATYIKWMNTTTHTWMRHDRGSSENITHIEVGEGYEIAFLGKSVQTKYTFTGMPGAMIFYDNVSFGFDATFSTGNADSLSVVVDPLSGDVDLSWDVAAGIDSYYVYNSSRRDGFWGILGVDYSLLATTPLGGEFCTHSGAALAGTEQFYMVVPFISGTGEKGVSSYTIGVWTASYLDQYDTFGIPLKMDYSQTADWYCDNIPDTVGMNYYNINTQRWSWHSTRMPEGAFDPMLIMTEGYQISTSSITKFTFVGI